MKKYKKVVLKIGSALISESNSTSSKMIKDLSSQISLLHHDTKFIIVTHHALTMSKMNRLYGVTMPEKGISQLVAVDLQKAESMVA